MPKYEITVVKKYVVEAKNKLYAIFTLEDDIEAGTIEPIDNDIEVQRIKEKE